MIALFRLIFAFFRKEELMAFDYIRKHRRRQWLIGLDAVLSVALVCVGFSLASASSKNDASLALMRAGAIAMPSSDFVDHIHSQGGGAYWLGDISGFEITSNETIDSSRSISYVNKGSDPYDLNRAKITVVTHMRSTSVSGVGQFGSWSEPSTTVTSSGLIVEYDLNSMMGEVVSFTGSSYIVSIRYPTAQTLQVLLENAVALRLII